MSLGPALAVAVASAVTTAWLLSEPGRPQLAAPAVLLGVSICMAYLIEHRSRDRQRAAAAHDLGKPAGRVSSRCSSKCRSA